MRNFILLGVLALAACAGQRDDELRAQLRPYIGRPLTAYLMATGDTPVSFYDLTGGRRSFLFERAWLSTSPGYADPRYGIYVPAVSGTARCATTVVTRRVNEANSPDAFVIESLTAAGNC